MIKQPMLAVDCDPAKLKFPLLASPKIDGIRCVIVDGVPMSRSMKPIPNEYLQRCFYLLCRAKPLEGLDGELVVGEPFANNCMQATTSGVMSKKGAPDFKFFVFDDADPAMGDVPFRLRSKDACESVADMNTDYLLPLWQLEVHTPEELEGFEEVCLLRGYEGLILRDPNGRYKQGRSTVKEGLMLKLKRFTDGEAVVIGVEELMRNENGAYTNEVGRTQRSSAKAGLVPGGVLGALRVRDLKTGVEFSIGSGFDAAQRAHIWNRHTFEEDVPGSKFRVIGETAKYKSFQIGVKDAPRFPVFLGFRDPRDMS